MSYDVIVVGGGAIGLSVARCLALDQSVLLIERGALGRESSWAAAGMLCPHSEADEDTPLLKLSLSSLSMYRTFAAELLDETGIDIEYVDHGVLVLASTEDELAAVRDRCDWQKCAGLDVSWLSPEETRACEPGLTLEIHGAMFCPGDHQIRPRRLIEALEKSCSIRGVDVINGTAVDEVLHAEAEVHGVRAGSQSFAAPTVIVAAGAWASQIRGLDPLVELRPRKGQILALQMPGPTFHHVVRWGRLYFVPRQDGELVIGATNEDSGFDQSLTAAGLGGLLQDAARMSSEVGSYPLLETWTGLRPVTLDGLPALGAGRVQGLLYALGHYRNGILLAPITAQVIGALARAEAPPVGIENFSPLRFA